MIKSIFYSRNYGFRNRDLGEGIDCLHSGEIMDSFSRKHLIILPSPGFTSKQNLCMSSLQDFDKFFTFSSNNSLFALQAGESLSKFSFIHFPRSSP